jgi:transposase-like protein
MPKRYAREFRRAVCARLVGAEKVSSLSPELGVSEATLYKWKRQALIDAGRAEGVKSFEADELAQAQRTIAGLEVVRPPPVHPNPGSGTTLRRPNQAGPFRQSCAS